MYDTVQDYTNLEEQASDKLGNIKSKDLLFEHYINNQDHHIMNTPFNPKIPELSHEKEWKTELENRPTNSHFHGDKGYKYDVLVNKNDRYVIENERLGNMRTFPDPMATLLRYILVIQEWKMITLIQVS